MNTYPEWLTAEGRVVFDKTLPKLKIVSAEALEMLAAYADAIVNMRRLRDKPELAKQWHSAAIYARNGLGIGPKVFIDFADVLIDWPFMELPIEESHPYSHLELSWQLPESLRPADYLTRE